jgi:hypothetical protein
MSAEFNDRHNNTMTTAGSSWEKFLQLLLDIALGNEPEEGHYYNVFKQSKA